MKLSVIAAALSTLLLTSCGDDPTRAIVLTPDPARYAACPVTFPSAPTLPPLSAFKLPDGREVALLDVVYAREVVTARYVLAGRGAWHDCASVVGYVRDWAAEVTKPTP